ncbi:MAG: hypothetical protein ABSH33_12530 [Steroidobacteraceae bacterium]|jgi:uncharacterized membrane-anchored protein
MQEKSTPELGIRYWVALCTASVAGCNLGDFVSLYLHLGHWIGLLPLALVAAAILVAERRARASEGWYWAAIIVVRTAATNAADLATHTFNLDYSWVIAALEALQVLVVLAASMRTNDTERGRYPKPLADGWYWASMMTAGTLGTALGDCTAEVFNLGTGWGTVALGAVVAATLAGGFATRWRTKASYWFAVIAIRSAGTTAGDWLAFSEGSGIGLGLLASTCISCAIFVAILLIWKPPGVDAPSIAYRV